MSTCLDHRPHRMIRFKPRLSLVSGTYIVWLSDIRFIRHFNANCYFLSISVRPIFKKHIFNHKTILKTVQKTISCTFNNTYIGYFSHVNLIKSIKIELEKGRLNSVVLAPKVN